MPGEAVLDSLCQELAMCQQDEMKTYLGKKSRILNRHIYIQQICLNRGENIWKIKK